MLSFDLARNGGIVEGAVQHLQLCYHLLKPQWKKKSFLLGVAKAVSLVSGPFQAPPEDEN